MKQLIIVFIFGCLFTFVLCGLPNLVTMYKTAIEYDAVQNAWANGWIEGFNSKWHESWGE